MVREQTDRFNDDDDYVLIFAEELYRLVGLSPTLGLVFNLDKYHLSQTYASLKLTQNPWYCFALGNDLRA